MNLFNSNRLWARALALWIALLTAHPLPTANSLTHTGIATFRAPFRRDVNFSDQAFASRLLFAHRVWNTIPAARTWVSRLANASTWGWELLPERLGSEVRNPYDFEDYREQHTPHGRLSTPRDFSERLRRLFRPWHFNQAEDTTPGGFQDYEAELESVPDSIQAPLTQEEEARKHFEAIGYTGPLKKIQDRIWMSGNGLYVLKMFKSLPEHDGDGRYRRELLFARTYNPLPAQIVWNDDQEMAIIFENVRSREQEPMEPLVFRMQQAAEHQDESFLERLIQEAAHNLARQHTLHQFDRFGWMTEAGVQEPRDADGNPFAGYFEYLFSRTESRLKDLQQAGFSPPSVLQVQLWREAVDRERLYVLNHADYNPWNIFHRTDGSIGAVIDGEWIRSAPRTRDISVALLRLMDASTGHPFLMAHVEAMAELFLRTYETATKESVNRETLSFYIALDRITIAWWEGHASTHKNHFKAERALQMANYFIDHIHTAVHPESLMPVEPVEFIYPSGDPNLQVKLTGEFSRWEPTIPMHFDSHRNVYRVVISLPWGTYPYKFLVNGNLQNDPRGVEHDWDGNSVVGVMSTHAALEEGIRKIQRSPTPKRPLISIDLDDTFLPLETPSRPVDATDRELSIVIAYLEAGGELAFNTLTQKDWLYRRLLGPLVSRLSREGKSHLLSQTHMVCADRGGKRYEVLTWDPAVSGYRLLDSFEWENSGKGEGLRRLLQHIGTRTEILAAYGDGFAEGQGDRGLFQAVEIPLIVNVGDPVPRSLARNKNLINLVHPSRRGPGATLNDFEFVTELLKENPIPAPTGASEPGRPTQTWTPDSNSIVSVPTMYQLIVRVDHPGFLWTGHQSASGWENIVMMPLRPDGQGHSGKVPEGNERFLIFSSGTGERPGRWDSREWTIKRTPSPTGATWSADPAKLPMAWMSTPFSYAVALLLAATGHVLGIPWLTSSAWYSASILYWSGHAVHHPAALSDPDVFDLTTQKFVAIGLAGHATSLLGLPFSISVLITLISTLAISRTHWEINAPLARRHLNSAG